MSNPHESQKFASKLLRILGENRWREARWVLLLLVIALMVFFYDPDFLKKKPNFDHFNSPETKTTN